MDSGRRKVCSLFSLSGSPPQLSFSLATLLFSENNIGFEVDNSNDIHGHTPCSSWKRLARVHTGKHFTLTDRMLGVMEWICLPLQVLWEGYRNEKR